VDAGFLDVLHDAADYRVVAVGEGVDVDFQGIFQNLSIESSVVEYSTASRM